MVMKITKNIIPFLAAAILVSCTKIIDVDLNSANPQLIVEANINNQPGPYFVKLSRSVNFDEPNIFPAATGAIVVISDDFSNVDTLQEIFPGTYRTNFIQGINNRNYYLYINDGGNIHTAQSYLNPIVTLDSIPIGSQPNPFGGSPIIYVTPNFNDPAGIENYYKINEVINDTVVTRVMVSDDKSFDGETYNRPVFNFGSTALASGDTVTINLLCIDKPVYTYYFSFSQLSGFGANQSATPANPVSNITGTDVLGYFNASSSDVKTVVIP